MTDFAMEHRQAQQTQAVERYLLNEMPAAERDAFEEHYFGCRECAAELVTATKFMDNAKPHILNTGQEAAEPALIGAAPRTGGGWDWGRWAAALWSRPALAGACAVLVAFVGMREIADRPQGEVTASYFLAATRAEPKVINLSKSHRKVAIRLERTQAGVTEYEFSLPSSQHFQPVNFTAADGVEEMQFTAPVDALRAGENKLVVRNRADGSKVAEIIFVVKFQ